MWRPLLTLFWLTSCVIAQKQNFLGSIGTRSLWIPYKTISGVPSASVFDHDGNNRTTYILSCPTDQPECALKPKLTLTEGTDLARWTSSTSGTTEGASSGTVVINCPLTNSPVTCFQNAQGDGMVQTTSDTVAASDIVYQEVNVTALASNKKNNDAKTTAKNDEKTSTTSSASSGGAAEMTGMPWVGAVGAVGAGLVALAAL